MKNKIPKQYFLRESTAPLAKFDEDMDIERRHARFFLSKVQDGGESFKPYPDENNAATVFFTRFVPAANELRSKKKAFAEKPKESSIVLQKWSGYVEEINGDGFSAILSDATGDEPDIRAFFTMSDVSEGDKNLVREGAFFDWAICKKRKHHGQVFHDDKLVFKRLPMWKKSDLDAPSARVEKFNAWLNSEA